jgi:hypothetical protein
MLPRPRAGNASPTAGAQVERERDARQAAPSVDAAEDVELAARDRRGRSRARIGQRREPSPGAARAEREDCPQRIAVRAVATDDVDDTVGARSGRVVDRDRDVRKATPGVARDRVRVGAGGIAAVGPEAADRHDLAACDGGRDLGARLGQRRVSLPVAGRGRRRRDGQEQPEQEAAH